MDIQSGTNEAMAAIDIGAGGLLSGDTGDLVELGARHTDCPGKDKAPSTNWPPLQRSLVVAKEVFTPNSYRVAVLSLADAAKALQLMDGRVMFIADQVVAAEGRKKKRKKPSRLTPVSSRPKVRNNIPKL